MVSNGGQLAWPAESRGYCGDRAGEQKRDVPGALQAVYTPGQVINVDHLVTENHLGRIDMQLCDVTAKPGDNKCITLKRADGKSSSWYLPFIASWSGGNRGSEKPIYSDGSFGMYTMPDVTQEEGCTGQYICSGYKGLVAYRTQWQLPTQLPCRRCKLMWTYLTAHNCWPPCNPANADEVTCENKQDFLTCGAPNAQYPESFWNCADVRIKNTGNTSDDSDDEYQIPADTPAIQQPDDSSTQAPARRDLPAWEAKISVSNAPFGAPRVVKMHSGGWRMTEMAPRIRKEAARQMPEETPDEEPTGHADVEDATVEQPELGRRMLLHGSLLDVP